jgi:haloacetate dehalogenase
MFEGFETQMVDTGEAILRVRHGGHGPPILLLHGYPQTHAMWHKVAPLLARDFTVVAPDLRGYGDSSKPETTKDHEPYSKRAMARDAVALMQNLGFDRFSVAGHDRGGRVAYRLALDHPDRVTRLATLDIIPTGDMWRQADMAFGLRAWHWFFLAQPAPLPEKMIGADPDAYYFQQRDLPWLDKEALADYLRGVHNPAAVHAMCEDYRAGATYDYQLDEADRGKKRITCPLLALWGSRGSLSSRDDVLQIWRTWADDVRGHAIESGHYLAEEAPEATYAALRDFFSG